MAAGDLITNNYEVEFNGQLFNGASGIEIVDFDLFSNVEVRSSDIARPLDHGKFAGDDYYGQRSIMLSIEIWGTSDTTFQAALNKALTAFVTNTEMPIVTQLPVYGKIQSSVRVRKRSGVKMNLKYGLHVGEMTVELVATDPRLYSQTLHSVTNNLQAPTGGITFNLTFPMVFGSSTSPITIINNAGTFETRPLIIITGPITNPNLENVTTGKIMNFIGVLASTDQLYVDFLNHTVYLNNTASRYSWLQNPQNWWNLQPGNNSVRFSGTAGAGTPTINVQWRDAYA